MIEQGSGFPGSGLPGAGLPGSGPPSGRPEAGASESAAPQGPVRRAVRTGQRQRICAAAPGPYPDPAVKAPSPEYAALLLDDFAGRDGELTAICQYSYHHLVVPDHLAWIADLLEDVAIVEMRHLELLGETIRLLGADPRFYGEDGVSWDARSVAYRDNLRLQLEADVEAERGAIAQYERHFSLIADPHIRQLLTRIIADEQLHLFLFRWALNYVR
ncbi:MAG: manganese catalase family protein [Bacillota bacterium]|nr:manganese catalase family protein [Bacillota bacterium]